MYRMVVRELGGPQALEQEQLEARAPSEDEVVVEIAAIGCNFFDTLITRGQYQRKPPLPFAPGGEAAGTVMAVGDGVSDLTVGQRVLALPDHGAYASVLVVPRERVIPIPDAVGLEDAVTMGIVYQTSHMALSERAALAEGETLLVHAAAGGVGLAAVEIGKALGATVIGTAGSEKKLALAREHGADHAISYRDPSWVEKVRELTGGRGVDVVYDPVGGDAFDGSTKCIAWSGRILVIGFASGRIPEIQLNRVLLKNISIVGLHWGTYFEHRPEAVERTQRDLFRMYAEGLLRPLSSARYPLTRAATALEALASRRTTGKVLLIP